MLTYEEQNAQQQHEAGYIAGPAFPVSAGEEQGIDLFALLIPVARRWRLILALTLGLGALGLLASLFVHVRYTTHSTFLLDTQDSGNPGSGMNIIFGRQSDPTISLLSSDTVTDAVVQQADLIARESDPKKKNALSQRSLTRSELTATRNADGLFMVTIADLDAKKAVDIANAYLSALQYLNDKMNFEAAAHSREFYEAQVNSERRLLEAAEQELAAAQQRTGIIQPQTQTGIALSTLSSLRSQITGLEVQLASAREGATDENPAVVRLRTQIGELRAKEASLQGSIQSLSRTSVPEQNLELQRLQRNVTYHESLLTSLGAQFERARIQETFASGRVRVVDRAGPPSRRTLPKRLLFTFSGALLGFLGALTYIALQAWRTHILSDPMNRERVRQLRMALAGKAEG